MVTITSILSVVLLSSAAPNPGAQANRWIDKTIVLKKQGTIIFRLDEKGRGIPLEMLSELDYRVIAEQGDRVQVKARNGVAGWIDKSEVVVLEDAPTYFTERIQENPGDADAYNRRAWAWKLKGELDIAIKDFGEAIELLPDAALFNNRGTAYHAKKEHDKAVEDYSAAIRLNPKFVLPYFNRALVWEEKKGYDQAIDDYTQALRLDPKYVAALRNRGLMHHAKKDYDRAIEDFSEAIRLDPRNAHVFNDRAISFLDRKDLARAEADLSEALRIEPGFFYAFYNRGRVHEATKKYESAISDFTEAIRLSPRYLLPYWARAQTWNRMGKYENARADYDAALRLESRNAGLCNAAAWLLATCPVDQIRDGKRALELASRAVELSKTANTLDTLAAAHAELGEFDHAIRVQEEALKASATRQDPAFLERLEAYRKGMPYRQK